MAEGQRRRRDYQDDQIIQLFQGHQYAEINGTRGISYPGDRDVRGASGITVQMGYLDLGHGAFDITLMGPPMPQEWFPAENMAVRVQLNVSGRTLKRLQQDVDEQPRWRSVPGPRPCGGCVFQAHC